MTLSHKEMTKHIHDRVKQAGIKARVRLYTACGTRYVQVFGVDAHASFDEFQARTISTIAKVNRLTLSRGGEIDDSLERWTGSGATQFDFEYHS